MSERWKYQIKSGLFFGLAMSVIIGIWEVYISSFSEVFLNYRYYLRIGILTLAGIFFVGYFHWKEKQKQQK